MESVQISAGNGALDGFVVAITADRRWEEQAALLTRRGARIIHGPTIRTLPLNEGAELRTVTEGLIARPPTHLLANTGIGIRAWMAAADSWGLGDALSLTLENMRIFARGPKAAAAVHQAGLEIVAKAESERLDETVRLLIDDGIDGATVAFQCHGDDAPDALERLRAAGATVVEIPIYRWLLPDDVKPALQLISSIISGTAHAVTFTSAPAFDNMMVIAEDAGLGEALTIKLTDGSVQNICVGPVCALAVTRRNLPEPVIPQRYRLGPMIRVLEEQLLNSTITTRLGGQRLVLAGRRLQIGDAASEMLSPRDETLLRSLLQRSGTVVTKAELLNSVWGDEGDEHTVEVAIGRLRKRLGAAAAGIVAVRRRGYLVANVSAV
jgi:uroporphyrinogen-III synthase